MSCLRIHDMSRVSFSLVTFVCLAGCVDQTTKKSDDGQSAPPGLIKTQKVNVDPVTERDDSNQQVVLDERSQEQSSADSSIPDANEDIPPARETNPADADELTKAVVTDQETRTTEKASPDPTADDS